MNCGVGCRCGSDPALLWLWHRPVATAPIRPIAWEPPYATGAALKKRQKQTPVTGTKKKLFGFFLIFRAASEAYGGSQAMGLIGAAAAACVLVLPHPSHDLPLHEERPGMEFLLRLSR